LRGGAESAQAALAAAGKRRGPGARAEARRADLRRHRREPARELRIGLEPVADGALVAVVELDEIDRDLRARRAERLEVAEQRDLGDVVEEVVPAAPARLERRARARARALAVLLRERLEQPRGPPAERRARRAGERRVGEAGRARWGG